jgi:hypothetical protein
MEKEHHGSNSNLTSKQLRVFQHIALERVEFGKDYFGALDKKLTGRRQADAPSASVEQRNRYALFQKCDCLRQRRLSDAKLRCGLGKMTCSRNRNHVA